MYSVVGLSFCCLFVCVYGHGRLLEPPSRSSMWRVGFKTPKNYNDNQLNCGGFMVSLKLTVVFMFVCLMVLNATFNNISVISWRSGLLVEETGVPGENHRPVASHWQALSHNVVHIELTTSVVIGAGCIGSCESNYHTILLNQ